VLWPRSVHHQQTNKKQTPYFRTYTARARSAIFPKLCMVIELVVPIKQGCHSFFDLIHSFSARGQNVDFWLLSKNNTGSLLLRGNPAGNKSITSKAMQYRQDIVTRMPIRWMELITN